MVDQKITALTADTAPTTDDLVVTVNDPSGTPANKKVTVGNLLTTSLFTNPYKFGAYRAAGSLTISNVSDTQVTFDTEEFDTGSNFATSTFTAPIAGFYWIGFAVGYSGAGSNTRVYAYIAKNSAEIKRGQDKFTNALSGGADVSATLQLAANDTITFFARAVGASVTAANGQNVSYCSGFLISAS